MKKGIAISVNMGLKHVQISVNFQEKHYYQDNSILRCEY